MSSEHLSIADPGLLSFQWQLDNLDDLKDFLKDHVAEWETDGSALRIRGPDGLEIILNPGDCLLLDGDRLGVVRVPSEDRRSPIKKTIEVRCEQCDKPIKVDVDVLQDPATIWVVCSQKCKEAYEFGLLVAGNPPPLGSLH